MGISGSSWVLIREPCDQFIYILIHHNWWQINMKKQKKNRENGSLTKR